MRFLGSNSVLIALAIVLTVVIIVLYYPLTLDFNVYNPFWNGYEILSEKLNAKLVLEEFKTPTPPQNYVLILIPYERFSSEELSNIVKFVREGGILVLMDDYGYGNEVLEKFNADVRFMEGMLVDPIFYYKNSRLPVIRRFEFYLTGLEKIYFNHASALNVTDNVKVLGWSSLFSYLDENFNGVYDSGEPKGPFPVIVEFSYGRGKVIVISDPSIGINSMINLGDNLVFFEKICEGRSVVIDQSHIPVNTHFILKAEFTSVLNYVSKKPILTIFILLMSLGLAFIVLRRRT